MHYQVRQPQGKLVRVTKGHVFNVAADIRRSSPTFQQWVGIELSETNLRQVWIPVGFAHGFLVLSDVAECQYKTTAYYAPEHERCIAWDDPSLNIQWPIEELGALQITMSLKDTNGARLSEVELFA